MKRFTKSDASNDRVGAVDIGTNSIKLWIAEGQGDQFPKTIEEDVKVTQLGKDLERNGYISREPFSRSVETVKEFVARARSKGVRKIVTVTTSAVRRASNDRLFLQRLRKDCGLAPTVISGEEEAMLSYIGAVYGKTESHQEFLTIDLGGGSTDVVKGEGLEPGVVQSFPIGSVKYYEDQDWWGKVPLARIRSSLEEVGELYEKRLRGRLKSSSSKYSRDLLPVGIGGTFTTIAQIDLGLEEFDRSKIEGHRLDRDDLTFLVEEIARRTPEEREKELHVEPGRKEYVLGGCCLVRGIMDAFDEDEIAVTTRGLRHGLILGEFV